MGTIILFNFMTLDGCTSGPQGDISWHGHSGESSDFASEMLKAGATLLFGRITYQMMAQFWPTPLAMQTMPRVAEAMNNANKIVISRTLKTAGWKNTRILSSGAFEELRSLKQSGRTMTLLGSGTIATQLAQQGLIDEYQIMVDPVLLGNGTPLLKGLGQQIRLQHIATRAFSNGSVLLTYQPQDQASAG